MTSRALAITVLLAGLPAAAEVLPSDIALVEDTDGSITQSAVMMDQYLRKAACAFYQTHMDKYDAIFVFSAIPLDFFSNTQQGWPVKQDEKGIGRMLYNQTASFCSKTGRLSQAVKMGNIDSMPDDPDDLYKGIPMYTLSGIELMGHEFGHHWLASVTFAHEDGVKHCMLRGYEPSGETHEGTCDGYDEGGYNQHWANYFNSGGIMYGNNIIDLGGGQFKIWNEAFKYGPLDQYLMGLRAPEEVGPLFIADPGDGSVSSPSIPAPKHKEQVFSGTRIDFTVEDVIRSVGPREPFPDECHWKGAIIAVHAKGKPPTMAQLQKLAKYGNRWEEWYAWATDGRGSFDMTLAATGKGTPQCPAKNVTDPEPTPDQAEPVQLPDRVAEAAAEVEEDSGTPVEGGDAGVGPEVPTPDPGAIADASARPEAVAELPAECTPGERQCSGSAVHRCDPSGKGWTLVQDCADAGKVCRNSLCLSASSPDATGGEAPGGGGCAAGAGGGIPGLLFLALLGALPLRRGRRR